MLRSLVGSEMCIRDRRGDLGTGLREAEDVVDEEEHVLLLHVTEVLSHGAVSYTHLTLPTIYSV